MQQPSPNIERTSGGKQNRQKDGRVTYDNEDDANGKYVTRYFILLQFGFIVC